LNLVEHRHSNGNILYTLNISILYIDLHICKLRLYIKQTQVGAKDVDNPWTEICVRGQF